MTNLLSCPWCGSEPHVGPDNPQREGNAIGYVECLASNCPANPRVEDGELIADDRGPDLYKAAAIARWNKRADPSAECAHVQSGKPFDTARVAPPAADADDVERVKAAIQRAAFTGDGYDMPWKEMAGAAISALHARPARAGYVLVPVEPTPEMIAAGKDANPTMFAHGTERGFAADVAHDIYRAMIAAAPRAD